MKDFFSYLIIILSIFNFALAFIILYFIKDHFKLKYEVKKLKHDIRCIEEEHGIFKGSEKGN